MKRIKTKISDFSKRLLKWLFHEKFLNSNFTKALIFEPIRLIYFHWKCKSFYLLLIDIEIFYREISEYFFINRRDLNKFFFFRIWMWLLNSKTLDLFFEAFNVSLIIFSLKIFLIIAILDFLMILLTLLRILFIFKLKWLIRILRILIWLSILLRHYDILSVNG